MASAHNNQLNGVPAAAALPGAAPAKSGRLDGFTILRYAHAFDTGGGVELHLADLNRELSQRNRITTVQMHLTLDASRQAETEATLGQSRFIKVPLLVSASPSAGESAEPGHLTGLRQRWQAAVLDKLFCTPALNAAFARWLLRWRKIPVRRGEPADAGGKAAELLRRFKVNLVVLHTSGGADASAVLDAAQQAGVPVALIHHFSNDRLGNVSLRQQTARVAAVGGASLVGVPAYLAQQFANLSDAVDLDFYHPRHAQPQARRFAAPVLYAPGRITPDKGQMDVIKVASQLKQRGLATTVVFAGRVDCPKFEAQLHAAVAQEGLTGSVEFIGQLSREQYRDGFGAAHLTLMPTYHHEGMPRTLIDAQAMKAPPIVYDIGGTREGVKHLETGFLIRLGDINAVADAAEKLLRDASLHAKMAEAGRRFVEQQFSLAAFAARHEDFYLASLKRTAAAH